MGISSVTNVTHVTNISNNMNSMTELFNYIHSIPIDNSSKVGAIHEIVAIHDIHYKFIVPDIHKIMAQYPKYKKLLNPVSNDWLGLQCGLT